MIPTEPDNNDLFFCNFATNNMVDFICVVCGRQLRAIETQTEMPKFICLGPATGKDLIGQIKTLARSTANTSANSLCTREQIDKRYNICASCPHFKNGTCALCGCPLTKERDFINKLAFKREECPEGKWTKEF